MDLLIKGFGLPKNGHNSFLIVTVDGDVYEKTGNRQEDEKIVAHYELLKGVKAIELPPHGRLGDLDALKEEVSDLRLEKKLKKWCYSSN